VSAVVVDANVVFEIVSSTAGSGSVAGLDMAAPPLLWPEVRSALHVAMRRGLLDEVEARASLVALESAPVRERRHRKLGAEAWRIADELGWAKTYDAEYLALASLLGAGLATFDRRMLRAAERLGIGVHALA
jgi:predicted nucleic acid-binding protein